LKTALLFTIKNSNANIENMKTNNVKKIRKQLGLSQKELADGVGVYQSNISHCENFVQEVSPDLARKIIAFAKTLGVEVTFNDIYVLDPKQKTDDKVFDQRSGKDCRSSSDRRDSLDRRETMSCEQ
jgi:DNA-binding XRE family transcriptional regulator